MFRFLKKWARLLWLAASTGMGLTTFTGCQNNHGVLKQSWAGVSVAMLSDGDSCCLHVLYRSTCLLLQCCIATLKELPCKCLLTYWSPGIQSRTPLVLARRWKWVGYNFARYCPPYFIPNNWQMQRRLGWRRVMKVHMSLPNITQKTTAELSGGWRGGRLPICLIPCIYTIWECWLPCRKAFLWQG